MARAKLLVIERGRAISEHINASPMKHLFMLRCVDHPASRNGGQPPHLILFDVGLLDASRIENIEKLARDYSGVPLLLIASSTGERDILRAIRAGATGCLLREDLERRLIPAIHDALEGGAPMSREVARLVLSRARRSSAELAALRRSSAQLAAQRGTVPPRGSLPPPAPRISARKQAILGMLAKGLSYEQIATAHAISVNTVRSHVREIYSALEVSSKVEAVMAAVERGLLKR